MRSLSKAEIEKIKNVKAAANQILTDRLKPIREKLAKFRKRSGLFKSNRLELEQLEANRNQISLITGLPIIIRIRYDQVVLDYELLRKLCRNTHVSHGVILPGKLIIHHTSGKDSGILELYAMPGYQEELLQDLPVIEIDSGSPRYRDYAGQGGAYG